MTNLQQTFLQALQSENLDKISFSRHRGTHPSEVSRFMKTGKISKAMNKAIFTGWAEPGTTIAIHQSHFQDIMDASGLSAHVTINAKTNEG